MKEQAKNIEMTIYNEQENNKNESLHEEVIKVLKGIPLNAFCLDVGCGSARIGLWIAQNGANSVGIDIARKRLKFAKESVKMKNITNLHLIQGDIENMPFKDGSFDSGICHAVLHHFPDPSDALREIIRVCKSDLILIEPNGNNPILSLNRVISKSIEKFLGLKWQILVCGTINETLHTPMKYINIMKKESFGNFKIQFHQFNSSAQRDCLLQELILGFVHLQLKVVSLLPTPFGSNFCIIEARRFRL